MADQIKPEDLERNYIFHEKTGPGEKDIKRIEVPESELDQEQIGVLVARLSAFYHSMPGIVQDQFTSLLADELKLQYESVNKSVRQSQIITPEEMLKFTKPGQA